MKKIDIYKIRELFAKINSDYKDDVGFLKGGSLVCRASKIEDSIKKGIIICNEYINKMEPL